MYAGSAASTGHRRGHFPIQRSVGQASVGPLAAGHASLLGKLRLHTGAALSESRSLHVSGGRDGERRRGRRLVSRGAALARQSSMPLVRSVVATVLYWVSVQNRATLRYQRVVSENRTGLIGMRQGSLSGQDGAALTGLRDGRLSAQYRAALTGHNDLLIQSRLSAENWAALNSLLTHWLSAENRATRRPLVGGVLSGQHRAALCTLGHHRVSPLHGAPGHSRRVTVSRLSAKDGAVLIGYSVLNAGSKCHVGHGTVVSRSRAPGDGLCGCGDVLDGLR